MLLRLFPVLFVLFAFSSAQKLIPLSSLKGGNIQNAIDITPPYAVYVSAQGDDANKLKSISLKTVDNQAFSIDELRNRKNTPESGLIQPFVVNSTAFVTTSLSDDSLSSLNGVIYATTTKQLQNQNFFVYDVDRYQRISISRAFIGNSVIVLLNTNHTTTPAQSSTIFAWLQSADSTVKMYKGIPSDDQEPALTQIFSNPVQTASTGNSGNGEWKYIQKVEKFSLSLGAFYIKVYLDITFFIEPVPFNIDGTTTTAYATTGFYNKPAGQAERNATVNIMRDLSYNGTTGVNFIGTAASDASKVVVVIDAEKEVDSMKQTPSNKYKGFEDSIIGKTITFSSVKMDGEEYFVQYYILRDQKIDGATTVPTVPPGATTRSTGGVEKTTKSGSQLQYFLAMITMIIGVMAV